MRCLFIRSPHIEKILAGKKTWELRGVNTKIRGTIGLIKSGSGQVVGIANLVDSKGPLTLAEWKKNYPRAGLTAEEALYDILINPATGDEVKRPVTNRSLAYTYAWVLKDAGPLNPPMPYVHKRGVVMWIDVPELDAFLTNHDAAKGKK